MINHVTVNFLTILLVSCLLLYSQKADIKGSQTEPMKEEKIEAGKVNIFKWTISKEYRRSYLKLISSQEQKRNK